MDNWTSFIENLSAAKQLLAEQRSKFITAHPQANYRYIENFVPRWLKFQNI